MSGPFGMSEDERKKISSQHKTEIKNHLAKKAESEKGIQAPKKEEKSS
jgi:hypothetical protein